MPVTIDQCREFVVLAELLSFTRAAHKLHMTQPALSKHVAGLERELKTSLLTRGGSGKVQLTQAGVSFLEACSTIVEAFDASMLDIGRLASKTSRPLVLAGPFYLEDFRTLAQSCIAALGDEAPHLRLMVDLTVPTPDMLREGLADMAIDTWSGWLDLEGLDCLPWRKDRMWVAMRPTHPLASSEGLSIEQLSGEIVQLQEGAVHYCGKIRLLEVLDAHKVRIRPRARVCSSFDLFTDIDETMVIVSEPIALSSIASGVALRPLTDDDAYFDIRVF